MTPPSFILLFLCGNFTANSQLFCLGMAPNPEVNNKMNNKVDGSVTPKPEPKAKVTCLPYIVTTVILKMFESLNI